MEQSFADLLSNAFPESSAPSFSEEDLDFENLNFDERPEEDKLCISGEKLSTKEDEALRQEETGSTAAEATDDYMEESDDEEQCEEEYTVSMDERLEEEEEVEAEEEEEEAEEEEEEEDEEEENYTSSDGHSDQEDNVSGDDEGDDEEERSAGEQPGEYLESVHCDGEKEDRIFAEGQPLVPDGAENPQVSNEGRGERDEEVFYFERVPERGSRMMIKGDGTEEEEQESKEEEEEEQEKQEDSSSSEHEDMKIEQGEDALARGFELEVENPFSTGDLEGAGLEFPEISQHNLQDLIAEVDDEVHAEKMKDFSGEEHEEAGESFADYPSDFSSCEYIEDGVKFQGRAGADTAWTGRAEDEEEEADWDVGELAADLETGEKAGGQTEAFQLMLGNNETSESESYSSSDDEAHMKQSDEEFFGNRCVEKHGQLEDLHSCTLFSNTDWNLNVFENTFLTEDLTTEDVASTLLSDVTQRPADDFSRQSDEEHGEKKHSASTQGSLDDSFFFNTELESAEITELGQLGDDEYEDDRNWEQEQERIKAFNEFYDDSSRENGGEERQIKVQFCTDPLSQVYCYDTESSDRDSLSSTDGEEDLSSADTPEESNEPEDAVPVQPVCECEWENTPIPDCVPELSDTPDSRRRVKRLGVMQLILRIGVMTIMGLLMFWFVTEQAHWFSQM